MDNQTAVPVGLYRKIIARIRLEQSAAVMRRRFVLAATGLLALSASTIPMWRVFWSDLTQSGFAQYASLLISDSQAVSAHWQDFTLSLAETFPIVSTIGLLAIIFGLLLALSYGIKYGRGFKKSYIAN